MSSLTKVNDLTEVPDEDLKPYPDRVTIFKELTVDQINEPVNQEKFNQLLTDAYPQFVEFCEEIIHGSDAENIVNISCFLEEGCLTFEKNVRSIAEIEISIHSEKTDPDTVVS